MASNKRSKPKVKYQGFALSVPLIEEIKKHIQDKPEYRSVTDFVRQAVREKMNEEKNDEIQELIKHMKQVEKKLKEQGYNFED